MREIQKRLNCVREDDQHWRRQLLNINRELSAYENQRHQDPGRNHEDILRRILPTYWEIFHTHNIYQRKKNQLPSRGNDIEHLPCYDVGIFLVGFSTLPIVLSLAEIQPLKQIYFLYSTDTVGMLTEIKDRISAMLPGCELSALVNRSTNRCSDFALEITSASDPVETFKQIKAVIDRVRRECEADTNIALDLTGGKKTMIGGGFTAGSIYSLSPKCDMFYVDSSEYDPDRGAPKPGTEFLSRLDNPYDVYNVQSVREAETLFDKHNYEAATILWDIVVKKLESHAERYGLGKEADAVQRNLDVADCYGLWDAFDYETAYERAKCYGNSWGYDKKHTNSSINVLYILSKVENSQTLFTENARIIHYAVDRYQNGIRRKKSDRFDDAIVRFTQVVEILCRYWIHQIARNKHLVNQSGDEVSNAPYKWKITPLLLFLFGKEKEYNRGQGRFYKISECGELLDIADYDYDNVHRITDLIDNRNAFVHVKNNPEWGEMGKNAENLQELARKFLKNFSRSYRCTQNLSFDDLLELHKFRR